MILSLIDGFPRSSVSSLANFDILLLLLLELLIIEHLPLRNKRRKVSGRLDVRTTITEWV